MFPNTNKELINILEQMLEINPYFRPTAGELLKNKIFDEIRIRENEQMSRGNFKIQLDFD